MAEARAEKEHLVRLTHELLKLGEPMAALEIEFALLVKRAKDDDHHAVAVGSRRIAESIVLHLGEELAPQFMKSGPERVQLIVQHLRSKGEMPQFFWLNIDAARNFSNQSAHSNISDVFAPGLVSSGTHAATMCVQALLEAIPAFLAAFKPPPMPAALEAPAPIDLDRAVDEAAKAVGAQESGEAPASGGAVAANGSFTREALCRRTVASSRDDDGVRAALVGFTGLTQRGLSRRFGGAAGHARLASIFPELLEGDDVGPTEDVVKDAPPLDARTRLARITAASIRDDLTARHELAALAGVTQVAISRRLNAAAGNARVGGIFPELFEEKPAHDVRALHDGALSRVALPTYQQLGEMTVKAAEAAELQQVVAYLTGLSMLAVKRRFGAVERKNRIVRRLFNELYEAPVVASLPAKAARAFDMAPLLARFVDEDEEQVRRTLREASADTRLGELFPALLAD